MKAGNSYHDVGTRVRVANISDPNDVDLNGRVGTLCMPFRGYPIRDVGIRIDPTFSDMERSVTVFKNEFEVIG